MEDHALVVVRGATRLALLRYRAGEPADRDFDRQLAARLGLPIFAGKTYDYDIAQILSHDWWDDLAWRPPA